MTKPHSLRAPDTLPADLPVLVLETEVERAYLLRALLETRHLHGRSPDAAAERMATDLRRALTASLSEDMARKVLDHVDRLFGGADAAA